MSCFEKVGRKKSWEKPMKTKENTNMGRGNFGNCKENHMH
jgi:hypothetical protein